MFTSRVHKSKMSNAFFFSAHRDANTSISVVIRPKNKLQICMQYNNRALMFFIITFKVGVSIYVVDENNYLSFLDDLVIDRRVRKHEGWLTGKVL
jgi:hypothetical protein